MTPRLEMVLGDGDATQASDDRERRLRDRCFVEFLICAIMGTLNGRPRREGLVIHDVHRESEQY